MGLTAELEQLRQWIAEAEQIVFFGGAGVSTESNIPDFRSAGGLYQEENIYPYPPEVMLSHSFFEENPELFFRYHAEKLTFPDAQPNPAHQALARLEQQGKLTAIITQNVDGLHQQAGSRRVFELHGSVLRNYCLNCGLKYGLDFMLEHYPGVPHCRDCGGIVRPEVVLYEEMLPAAAWDGAAKAIAQADLLIVGGTSLVVYPAAHLVESFRGRRLVLLNRDETPYDNKADLVLREPIGQVLSAVVD